MTEFAAAELAVQAALDAGARYADARVMHRRYESMTARDGEVDGVTQNADSGLGVRALVGSGWGFFAVPDLADAAARAAGTRAAEIAAASALVSRGAAELVPSEPTSGSWASECLVDPFAVSLADKGDLLVRATTSDGRARRRPGRGPLPAVGHGEVVRVERGPPHRPARPRVRGRSDGDGDRRRRDPAPLVPGRPRPVRHPGVGVRRRARPRGPRRPHRLGGPPAAQRPALPERGDDADPRLRAARLADPRVRRPRHRAGPHPRVGGGVRRDVVARPGPARLDDGTARS